MQTGSVKFHIFSSSATAYGSPDALPICESGALRPKSSYGLTKVMSEQVIRDASSARGELRAVLLSYFNPVGAHPNGSIGEDPNGAPNNFMPFVSQVAVERMAKLRVYGNDYPTPDGICVRDYIALMGLAEEHVAALRRLKKGPVAETLAVNLGTSPFACCIAAQNVHVIGVT